MAKKSKTKKILLAGAALIVVAGAAAALTAYNTLFTPNIVTQNGEKCKLYIQPSAGLDDVVDSLKASRALKNESTFRLTAKLKHYGEHVKAGYYEIGNGTSNFDLLRKLAAGNQTPVKLTFNNIRTVEDLAGRLSRTLQFDSTTALATLKDKTLLGEYGVDTCNAIALFIPNTYEVYWDVKPEKLLQRMKHEYDSFWNDSRKLKLASTGLTQLQVSTLASIVEEETIKADEQPVVAGLYLNRYRTGMKLESDPTVKFAVGDFSIRRVLNKHLETDSPYNTYKYAGLPPGPIRIPSISALNAVLNYKQHDYIYMCAKEDFSGYHNFATTLQQHLQNAQKYQRKLNELKIMK